MALEGPLGALLAVAIWTVCPCMTAESLAYLLHRLVHRGFFLFDHLFGELTVKQSPFGQNGMEAERRQYGFEEE